MSGLAKLIDDLSGSGQPATPGPPAGSDPSLSSVIEESTPPPVSDVQPSSLPDSGAQSLAPESAPETPESFSLRDQLSSEFGIDAGEFESDEAAFSEFRNAIGQAVELVNSEEYQAFLAQKGTESSEDSAVTPTGEPTPSVVEPPVEKPSLFTPAELSDEAKMLAQNGAIVRGEDGTWSAPNPKFKSFADEYNAHDMAVRATAMRFMQNPIGFINEIIGSQKTEPVTENETITSLQAEVEELKKLISQREQKAQADEIDQWRQTAPIKDAKGGLTPFAKSYMQWEKQSRSLLGDEADPVAVHRKTLEFLDLAGVKAEATPEPAPEPAQESEPFAQKAKRRTNGNGVNRLQEFAGDAPAKDPAIPKGKGGLPSLSGLIAEQQSAVTG